MHPIDQQSNTKPCGRRFTHNVPFKVCFPSKRFWNSSRLFKQKSYEVNTIQQQTRHSQFITDDGKSQNLVGRQGENVLLYDQCGAVWLVTGAWLEMWRKCFSTTNHVKYSIVSVSKWKPEDLHSLCSLQVHFLKRTIFNSQMKFDQCKCQRRSKRFQINLWN